MSMETQAGVEPFFDDLPNLDPIVFHEMMPYGWRGLTIGGEILEVKRPSDGAPFYVPDHIIVACDGRPLGRRAIRNDVKVDIDDYLRHYNRAVACCQANRLGEALIESQITVSIIATERAKFNRAMILLAAGRWREGFKQYWDCEQKLPFKRPQVVLAESRDERPWLGEELRGKRIVVMHTHGFGDTIQMLRYVPVLQEAGAEVVLDVPPELAQLARQFAPIGIEGDFFCPILHLLHFLPITPHNVSGEPYLRVPTPPALPKGRRRIGVAWSVGKPSDGDYPREIPLRRLVSAFEAAGDVELHSVQTQNADEARALGVHVHEFEDFANCAKFMMLMDEIVSIDTAALHLAGAIGHPKVTGLLSYWASWRWIAPWYSNVKLCRQAKAGDWSSALAQIHEG